MPPHSQGPGDAQSPGRRRHTKRHNSLAAGGVNSAATWWFGIRAPQAKGPCPLEPR